MIKLARRSIFKTVHDRQNPRKKLMFFDLVESYKQGLASQENGNNMGNGIEEEDSEDE